MDKYLKQCSYMGLGHMGLPVFKASYSYFADRKWTIYCVDTNARRLDKIDTEYVVKTFQLPENIDVLFLGVRPQDVQSIEKTLTDPKVVISMMAGVTCEEINGIWPASQVVRIIPNTPCEFGAGITPVYFNGISNSSADYDLLLGVLGCLGKVSIVSTERMIDVATGISAGGPAYFMFFAEAMISASLEMGFSQEEARELVAETMYGSGILLKSTNKSPETLAKEVMTPNGTTEKGINKLRADNSDVAIISALKLASARASNIANSNNR